MMLMAAAVVLPVVSFADMPATVYVVPTGTDGNTPTEPYDTWTTAANGIRTAADQVPRTDSSRSSRATIRARRGR